MTPSSVCTPIRARSGLAVHHGSTPAGGPGMSDGLYYHVLPDDPLAALKVLRQAAGLEPLPPEDAH
jgi:hypothetical protein